MNYDTNQRQRGGGKKWSGANWLVLSAERAPAGAAEHVKNAAAWWGSAAVWGLILMDPVLLSKVPLAPVSVRALWVTCAATETGTDPLHCLYSTKKVRNLKTRWCDASFVCARWYQSYTQQAWQKFLMVSRKMTLGCNSDFVQRACRHFVLFKSSLTHHLVS